MVIFTGGEPLPGGFVTPVARIGDTVRRHPGPRADFVHQLLDVLGQAGWPGAPRFRGIDEQGREILSYLDGHVAWQPAQPDSVGSDESLAAAAGLVREFHDLTAGSRLATGGEVVCHNDLSPKNTVYRDVGEGLRPVAFIDWDLAAPGLRIHDIAHLCWQFADLGPDGPEVPEAARRLRLICDGYGLADRGAVVQTILWWQDRCWRGILAGAAEGARNSTDASGARAGSIAEGDPAMISLRDSGAAASVRAQHDWVAARRAELEAALR